MKNERALFLIRFVIILVVLYAVIALNPVNDNVIVPFTRGITVIAAAGLRAIGEVANVDGTMITTTNFIVDVKNGCNGIEAIILLIAAIGAFPAPAMFRITGILGGFVALQAINIFRIAMLVWLGAHYPNVFQMFHVAVWQTVIILVSLFLFLVWSSRIAPRRLANSS
jgi:exosortase H (IPTLxxWG-CTERM-specific)